MPMTPFDLDDITNLVQRNGISARLSEQEKRLLVLLAARAGTPFDKHTLMEALWGQRAQWMEEAALVQLVSRLRRSLAPLGLQRAIVTVARVGYRFDVPDRAPDHARDAEAPGDVRERAHLRCDPAADGLIVSDAITADTARRQHDVARDGHGEVRRHGHHGSHGLHGRQDIVVRIPHIEYRLLCALRSPENVAHDKRTLIALLWPTRPDQDDTNLMQVVSRLRRKLIPLDLHRNIVTVPRVGYRFIPCDTPTPDVPDVSNGIDAIDATEISRSAPALVRRLRTWLSTRMSRALTRHLRWRGR